MPIELDYWKSVTDDEVFKAVADIENRKFVTQTLKQLTHDPTWTSRIITQVESGRAEIRCFLSWLARELPIKTYLEIGVRRGFSMAMVAARIPDVEIYGFDLWVKNYAGIKNPGPQFVQHELEKIGYRKQANFFSGNSHKTLPAFFQEKSKTISEQSKITQMKLNRPSKFDLLTIDGDHSLIGAYQDLLDTMPHCAVGGAVVFDDIAPDISTVNPMALKTERGSDPQGWGDLLGVWHAIQARFQNFRYFEYTENPPGVGLAIRLQ